MGHFPLRPHVFHTGGSSPCDAGRTVSAKPVNSGPQSVRKFTFQPKANSVKCGRLIYVEPVQAIIPDEPPLGLGTITYGRMFFIPVDHPHVMPAGRSLLNRLSPAHNRLEGALSNQGYFCHMWQAGVTWTQSRQYFRTNPLWDWALSLTAACFSYPWIIPM